MRLGDAIADRRRELGLSRRQLAERAALSYPFVAELERGRKSPSTASLTSLASALELTVAELVGAAEAPGAGEAGEAPRARHRDAPGGPLAASGEAAMPPPGSVPPSLRGIDETGAQLADLGRFVRDIVREELAAADEQRVDAGGGPSPPRARLARGALAVTVLDAVRQLLGDDGVVVDEQGDIPVRRDGAMLFVRVLDDPPSVLVFCPVLVDVPPTPALLERLNSLNEGVRFVRFCSTEGGVVVDLELFGDAFEPSLLPLAIRAVAGAAARFGPDLQEAHGGRLFLDTEHALGERRGTAGYL